ncbi:MAG TPA: response regulator [Micavibrio sp.]|nr:response regulator [Micavibrio sp.]
MNAAVNQEPYALSGVRILLVEEFPFMVALMTSMLREFGVGQVMSTDNVQHAKRLLVDHNGGHRNTKMIDILMTDLMGPSRAGVELVQWARSHKKDTVKYLPILFASAYTSLEVVEGARDAGVNEILMKPVSAEKLAQRLLYIIDRPRPFVKAPGFFGPDRRRKVEEFKGEEKRIRSTEDLTVVNEEE